MQNQFSVMNEDTNFSNPILFITGNTLNIGYIDNPEINIMVYKRAIVSPLEVKINPNNIITSFIKTFLTEKWATGRYQGPFSFTSFSPVTTHPFGPPLQGSFFFLTPFPGACTPGFKVNSRSRLLFLFGFLLLVVGSRRPTGLHVVVHKL